MKNTMASAPTKYNNKNAFHRFIFNFGKNKNLLLMTMPVVIFTFIFSYMPMFGIIIAFKNYKYNEGILGSAWVGLRNFKFFFTSPDSWRITRNTIGYNFIFIITNMVVATFIALLLYEISNRKLLKAYQTVMFIPHFLSWIVVAYMVYAVLSPASGMLNRLFENMGMPKIEWYTSPLYWIFIFPVAQIWKTVGFDALIYYACLLSIDREYFEAAEIEGASKWQIMTKIKLPFLYPLMIILTILAIGRIFQADFGLFYQLPMDSKLLYPTTDVIDTYVYRALTLNGDFALSSAAGFYKSFVGLILVIITNAVVKKINPDNSLY